MIGILVVTDGGLATEMVETVRGFLGPAERLEAVSTGGVRDPDVIRDRIVAALARVDDGDGSLILTDMLGDTATNLSVATSREFGAEVVAGVNMPMLVKAVTCRGDMLVRELARFIHRYGRDHVFWATEARDRERG
jgi:PTS system mannose-specific IIA component